MYSSKIEKLSLFVILNGLCFLIQQLNFIRTYLKVAGKEGQVEEERMLAEIKMFSLASDLFWGLWSVVNARLSQIPFGYWVRNYF